MSLKELFATLTFCIMAFAQLNIDKIFFEERSYFIEQDTEEIVKPFRLDLSILWAAISKKKAASYIDISPIINIRLAKDTKLYLQGSIIQNKSYFSLAPEAEKFYRPKKFNQLNYATRLGYIEHQFSFARIKIGRFYDRIGASPFENLLLGNHDFHTGYKIELYYKDIKFSNRFFQLSPFRTNIKINRYFFEHGISWKINSDFSIQFHETSIYSGLNVSAPFLLLNPLSIYHETQLNDGIESNSLYAVAGKYNRGAINLWFEFLLDDFQIDAVNEDKANKEPTELGVMLGASYRIKRHRFYVNTTLIRNRTYNDPNTFSDKISYNKFVDHGRVIGIEEGSNLIKFDFYYYYFLGSEKLVFFKIMHQQYGDESVFSSFNVDYFDYKENYFEPIPYGISKAKSNLSLGFISNFLDIQSKTVLSVDKNGNISFFLSLHKTIL